MLPDIPKARSKAGQLLLGKPQTKEPGGYCLWGLKESDTAEQTHTTALSKPM